VRTAAVSVGVAAGGVVVRAEAAALRRQLGAMPWCALEAVVAASNDSGLAAVSIRSLAIELGVSKNTVQRALAVLRDAGLIQVAAARREAGRFTAGGYRVTAASSLLARADTALTPASAVAEKSGRSRRARRTRVQPVVVEGTVRSAV